MTTRSYRLRLAPAGAGVLVLVAAACEVLGIGGDTAPVRVSLAEGSSGPSGQVVDGWYASVVGASAAISKDTVASLNVTVTDIQFLPKEDEARAGEDGAWISLTLGAPVEINLMALPTEGESPLVIASGSVPVGNYGDVRLFTSSASIVFKGDISLGQAITFEGGVPHSVTIPSGEQTGLKTDAEFTVSADAGGTVNDVALLFHPGTTFQNVTATGSGSVMLAPVIRKRS